jgi:flagellar M-ring protein FliF
MAEAQGKSQWLSELLAGLGGKARMGLLIGMAALGTALLVYLFWTPAGDYQVLYSNLSQQDAGEVIGKLKEKGVTYQLSAGGSAVLVPADQVYELRLTLASEGLPRGGNVGFEIFDQQSLGTTEFVQKLNYQRALQGELVRTIGQFSEVEEARVHIVMPKESVFLDETEPASAAVVLKVRPGRTLSNRQVEGIVHLVSASVEGLKSDNVKVVDMSGRTLFARDDEGPGSLSSSQLEYQRSLEDGLKRKVEGMLEKVVGPGKAIARVNADLDFTQETSTQEIYDPDSAVARTRQTSQETSAAGGGGAAGIPGPDYDANQPGAGTTGAGGEGGAQRMQESVSYEINKVAKQIVTPVGSIKRLSVAVIIDGVYQEAAGGEKKFLPRSKQELAGFKAIIERAVGMDEERGDLVEVTSIPFALPEEAPEVGGGWKALPAKVLTMGMLKTVGKVVIGLLLILFVLRPVATGLAKGGVGGGGVAGRPRLSAGATRLELAMSDGERLSAREQAEMLARSDPEKTAELLRGWLAKKE